MVIPHLRQALLAGIIAATPATAIAQQVGDWVLSPWRGSTVYYPGVIESRSGSVVTVRFDDGDVESRDASSVRAFDWRVGSRIACQWTDGDWYRATITWMGGDGYSLQIRYDDDGTIEDTSTGLCRTR
ncbi:MAG TPA: hypothetical protein VLA78_08285 [Paracoccaceae bacterium]|nr:hypothetical protein [Paracoccaceae bacterium]